MEIFYCISVFIFGAIIGSFLNVVIYRMHTGKSLNGRSHCMSCGTTLKWFELFPLFSYVLLLARCRYCNSWIPSRYFIVEILTGGVFVMLWHLFSTEPLLMTFYAILLSILILVTVYDIRHTIIPNEISVILTVFAIIYVGIMSYILKDFSFLILSLASGFGAAGFFAGLWYVSKGRWMGLGDAKLAFSLALIVGFPGTYSMIVFSFLIGAVISLGLIFFQFLIKKWKTVLRYSTTTITIKSEVPFAPFLVLGFMVVELFHADIFDITFSLLWL